MLQHAVEFDRAQAHQVTDPNSDRGFRLGVQDVWSWSATFFLLPLATAVVLTIFAHKVAPNRPRHTRVLYSWGIGYVVGFGIWMLLWLTLGGGTGKPAPEVLVIALVAWLLWPLGLSWMTVASRKLLGELLCTGVLMVLMLYPTSVPEGTKLLWLVLVGAIAGSIPYFWVYRRRHAVPLWG